MHSTEHSYLYFLCSLFQKEKVIKSQALYVRTRYQFYTSRVTHELTLVMCTETHACFMQHVLNHFPISTKSVMGQQIFVKVPIRRWKKIYSVFTQLLSAGGQTDLQAETTKLIGAWTKN